jgi:hypothetical protein
LGAGASRPFEIPTLKELTHSFPGIIAPDEKALYADIEKALKEAWSDDPDLEAVFTVIDDLSRGAPLRETGHTATYLSQHLVREKTGKDPGDMGRLSPNPEVVNVAIRLRKKFQEFIKDQCWNTDTVKLSEICWKYSDLLGKLAQKIGSSNQRTSSDGRTFSFPTQTSIYTTNYDLCFEYFMTEFIHAPLNLGFIIDQINARQFLPDKIKHLQKLREHDEMKLVKLHGSVDWFIDAEGKITRETSVPTQSFVPRRVVGEMMLYPIQEKGLYREPYFTMLEIFKEELAQTYTWIVIGHKFTDPIIRDTFVEASSPDKTIILVLPTATNVKEKELKELKGTFHPIDERFGTVQVNEKIVSLVPATAKIFRPEH